MRSPNSGLTGKKKNPLISPFLGALCGETAFRRVLGAGHDSNCESQDIDSPCRNDLILHTSFRGFARQGGFKRVVLADVPPGPPKPERGYKKRNEGIKTRTRHKKQNCGPKNRNKAHNPYIRQNHPFTKLPCCFFNKSLRNFLCNGPGLVTYVLCSDSKISPPEFFYVMPNPIYYTEKVVFFCDF